jgi:hypothetical protein
MNQKHLLEMAAKAVGLNVKAISVDQDDNFNGLVVGKRNTKEKIIWNPIYDNADAFSLMVDLGMDACLNDANREVTAYAHCKTHGLIGKCEKYGQDKRAATRLAIVRAVAAIGEAL